MCRVACLANAASAAAAAAAAVAADDVDVEGDVCVFIARAVVALRLSRAVASFNKVLLVVVASEGRGDRTEKEEKAAVVAAMLEPYKDAADCCC